MALKIDWNAINNDKIDSNVEQLDQEQNIDVPETIEKEKPVIKQNNDFAMGEEIENLLETEKPKTKKGFEGHNKDILSSSENSLLENSNELPQISPVVNENNKIDTNLELSKINKKTNEKVTNLLTSEIEKEKSLVNEQQNSVNTNKIKIVCIGGNEQYYKSVLSNLNKKFNDIEFVKYLPTGGKNAFYTIDVLQPEIILIYHKAQIQSALQFYDSIMNDADDNGVYYRDKYKNKRIIVIAENSISYEIKLREKGINFYIKELNPRTHILNTDELISVIREAKKDIDANINKNNIIKETPIVESNSDDYFEGLPTLDVVEKKDTKESIPSEDKEVNEKENNIAEENTQKKQTDNQEVLMSESQWRKKQMSVRRQESSTDDLTENGKIIGIYSTTGGAGKTMFASNLASILAKYGNQNGSNNYKVALVEYNLTCKSLDIFFNIKTNKDIASLAKEASEYADKQGVINITPEQFQPMIASHMYKIPDINLDVLPGISVPLELESIQKNFTTCLFTALKQMYDIVIVDTAADIAKTPILEAFNMIDEIYYIIPMDVSSIRNTKILIKFFTGMFNFSKDNVKVIINKTNPDNEEFGVDQIYAAFANDSCVPEGTIPRMDKDVLSSINRGIPLALEDISNPVANAIYSIALGINPRMSSGEAMPVEQKEEKTGFLGKLFGNNKKKKKNENQLKINKSSEKKKVSIFNKKKQKTLALPPKHTDDSEIIESKPIIPKKNSSLFGHNNDKTKNVVIDAEPKKKKGFLSKLFGSNKKAKSIKMNNKKKSGLAGILGKGKNHTENSNNIAELSQQSQMPQSRLQPIMKHQPRRR